MGEVMYDINSVVLASVLFASIAGAIELGYRRGRQAHRSDHEPVRTHVYAIQASLLGILALLLSFTFSLALERFDKRSEAVVEEANAIGTAYLRAGLLPANLRADARTALHRYADLRVEAGKVTLADEPKRQTLLLSARRAADDLWRIALQAAEQDANAVTAGLFIQALNETFDNFERRDAALGRHVPELILFLLYATLVLTGLLVGYSAGIGGLRPPRVTYILPALLVVLAFMIVDLDRPRRGLIRIDQSSLTRVQASIAADLAAERGQATEPAAGAPDRNAR